jgi:hypothetical protein
MKVAGGCLVNAGHHLLAGLQPATSEPDGCRHPPGSSRVEDAQVARLAARLGEGGPDPMGCPIPDGHWEDLDADGPLALDEAGRHAVSFGLDHPCDG